VKEGRYYIEENDRDNNRDFDRENDQHNDQERQIPDEKPNTELLGYYVSKGTHGVPEIYLCTETILRHTKNDEELTYLLAKVIIHELAHAYMDRRNYGARDEFYQWMEEGFANKITLEHFQDFESGYRGKYCNYYLSHKNTLSPYRYAKGFVLSQPDNYKLGYYLHIHRVHSHFWYNHKDDLKQKTKAKANWLNFVKANIRTGKFNSEDFYKKTCDVLLEDPYNELPKNEK
jgi:hypothetical protein